MKEIPIQDLRQRSVFIALPMYGGKNDFLFFNGMTDLCSLLTHHNIHYAIHVMANESLITRARNYLADEFLRSGMTHMMFVDADIGFSGRDVVQMLAYADPRTDGYDIMCGPYPKKHINWRNVLKAANVVELNKPSDLEYFAGEFVFNIRRERVVGERFEFPLNAPFEVSEGGTGFMLIQRRVFERIADAYPEYYYPPDHVGTPDFAGDRKIMRFFDCEIDRGWSQPEVERFIRDFANGSVSKTVLRDRANAFLAADAKASHRYLSEDYWFCRNALRTGSSVWMCPWIELKHLGTHVYTGSLNALSYLDQKGKQ